MPGSRAGLGVWLLRLAALVILAGLGAALLAMAARAWPDLPARLGRPLWLVAAAHALLLADLTSLIAVPLGTLAAAGFWRSPRGVWRAGFGAATLAVAASPLLAHAVAACDLRSGPWLGAGAVVPGIAACLVVFLVVGGARDRVHPAMLRAATAAGAGPWAIVSRVVAPAMTRPIGLAASAAFVTSLVETAFARAFAAPGQHDVAGPILASFGADPVLAPHTVLLLAGLATLPLLAAATIAVAAAD